MKVIFAGTPAFAVPSLQALIDANHTIVAVYTQPDRPAGRGQKLTASPIKQLAEAAALPLQQPLTLRDDAVQQILRAWQADIMVVVAYGLLLPPAVLAIPPLGCINVHASLLPRWRGAAPIQRAILAGDAETGITLMQMDQGLDTGAILQQVACPIGLTDTSASLHDRLAQLGASTLLTTLTQLASGSAVAVPQPATDVCYAAKIAKSEGQIDWTTPAAAIARQIRAFNPWPIAHTHYQQQPIRLWQAQASTAHSNAAAGTLLAVTAEGIAVAAGDNTVLQVLTLQLAGHKPLSVAEWLRGRPDFFVCGQSFTQ